MNCYQFSREEEEGKMFIYCSQNAFTTLMFIEAMNEGLVFPNFIRGGKCILRL